MLCVCVSIHIQKCFFHYNLALCTHNICSIKGYITPTFNLEEISLNSVDDMYCNGRKIPFKPVIFKVKHIPKTD